ncbi:MAG: hypothetical protein ACK5EW_00210 [Bacteroidota bacterium]
MVFISAFYSEIVDHIYSAHGQGSDYKPNTCKSNTYMHGVTYLHLTHRINHLPSMRLGHNKLTFLPWTYQNYHLLCKLHHPNKPSNGF